jgi:hypothetical protein
LDSRTKNKEKDTQAHGLIAISSKGIKPAKIDPFLGFRIALSLMISLSRQGVAHLAGKYGTIGSPIPWQFAQ